jgi:hypothetical protein
MGWPQLGEGVDIVNRMHRLRCSAAAVIPVAVMIWANLTERVRGIVCRRIRFVGEISQRNSGSETLSLGS